MPLFLLSGVTPRALTHRRSRGGASNLARPRRRAGRLRTCPAVAAAQTRSSRALRTRNFTIIYIILLIISQESVKDYTNAIRLESSNGNFYSNRAISYMCLAPPDYDKVRAPARVAAAPCVSRWPRSWRNVRAIF